MATIRKNVTMSLELAGWFEDKSKALGISQSAVMVMALSDYVKQEKAFAMMGNMQVMMGKLEQLEGNQKKS